MAKPSRRFSRTANIHCTNLRDVALAAVARRVEFLRARAGESKRQIEGLFQALLAQSFETA